MAVAEEPDRGAAGAEPDRGAAGAVWADEAEWERRRTPSGCGICTSGAPLDVIAGTSSVWVTAPPDAPLRGYVCVVSKTHACEPFELPPDAQARFWLDAMAVAAAVATVDDPVKMNYEVHGNTVPHLHLHLFPRHREDPYAGGPVDPRIASFHRSEEDITALRSAIRRRLEGTSQTDHRKTSTGRGGPIRQ